MVHNKNFSYSLYSSLPYATCSHLKHQSFILNPNLSFMDTTFSDIVYFVNEKSAGNIWDVQQFQVFLLICKFINLYKFKFIFKICKFIY